MSTEVQAGTVKRVVLFSGGIDSLGGIAFCLKTYPGEPLTALYVCLGHRYNDPEYAAASETIMRMREDGIPIDFQTVNLDIGMFEEADANLPGRNMYLAMVACNLGFSEIHIISQLYETSIPDRTPEFYGKASNILSLLYGREVAVTTPFWEVSKTGIVKCIIEAGLQRYLPSTWACYDPEGVEPCGKCSACFRRFVSLFNNGMYEPWFEKVPVREMSYRYLNGDYPRGRKDEVFKALQEHTVFGFARSNTVNMTPCKRE